jgi:hypothetical protein
MMKLEKGKWYKLDRREFFIVKQADEDMASSDRWQEIEPPVIKVVEKPKTLADVEPKVGMTIRRDGDAEAAVWTVVYVGSNMGCVESQKKTLGIIYAQYYPSWLVMTEPAKADVWTVVYGVTEPAKLTVEESLKPDNAGKRGRWKLRGGWVLEGEFSLGEHSVYPIDLGDEHYTTTGKVLVKRSDPDDIIEFLGWL